MHVSTHNNISKGQNAIQHLLLHLPSAHEAWLTGIGLASNYAYARQTFTWPLKCPGYSYRHLARVAVSCLTQTRSQLTPSSGPQGTRVAAEISQRLIQIPLDNRKRAPSPTVWIGSMLRRSLNSIRCKLCRAFAHRQGFGARYNVSYQFK